MSRLFATVGQSIGASASASSVFPMNIQAWFPLGWTGWISLQSKGLSRVFSNTTVQKHQSFGTQSSLWSNSHIHTWLLEKPWLWLCGFCRYNAVCFLKHCLKVKASQLCPTLCDPMGYIVHGILQARILEWAAFPFSRGSSQPRDWTQLSCIAGRFFISWAIR